MKEQGRIRMIEKGIGKNFSVCLFQQESYLREAAHVPDRQTSERHDQ